MKKMKKFFTLSRRAEGFTLVELIVVIAILAILGGVAVPAYGGYVKKANMTADQTLVSEVADALTLYYYSNPGAGTVGYVVLKPNAAAESDKAGVGEAAMKAVFGENWAETATLKYGEWNDDGLLATAAGQKNAAAVAGSSYLKGSTVPELLENVVTLTAAASGFLSQYGNEADKYKNLCTNFNGFEALATEAGLVKDGQLVDGVTSDQIANLMVLSVAQEVSTGNVVSPGVGLAQQYASLKGFALSGQGGPEALEEFEKMNEALGKATTMEEVTAAIDGFNTDENGDVKYQTINDAIPVYQLGDSGANDMLAFQAIMEGVNTVADDYTNADSLKDPNLYKESAVTNHVNTYISAAEMASTLGEEELKMLIREAEAGTVVVFMLSDGRVIATPAQARA